MKEITRHHLAGLLQRIDNEPRRYIQVISGPRQVGKTTLVNQLIVKAGQPSHYASADAILPNNQNWISQQWEIARNGNHPSFILVLDEIQKIDNWSELVKREWDEDTRTHRRIKVILLGSSRLLLQQGLTESLAGRFESTYLPHWSFSEMKTAFGVTPDQYIWFGGYPGTAALMHDEPRWKSYVQTSLIESSISRDILMLTRVDKPALMRRLFELGCVHSGQILSFNKMLGQLLDAGNTTTLAHYLTLLDQAGLLTGIEKFSPGMIRQRASSPKFQVHNTALLSAIQPATFSSTRNDPAKWGRWVESAIGAHLVNQCIEHRIQLWYWRHRNDEVDFVLTQGEQVIAIEVKTSSKTATTGMNAFQQQFKPHRVLLVGQSGIPIESFLSMQIPDLFDQR